MEHETILATVITTLFGCIIKFFEKRRLRKKGLLLDKPVQTETETKPETDTKN